MEHTIKGRVAAGAIAALLMMGCASPPATQLASAPPASIESGGVVAACGCWGYSRPAEESANPSCKSGAMLASNCVGYCMRGDSPWKASCK